MVTPPSSTDWLGIGTAAAVVIAAFVQKLDALRQRRASNKRDEKLDQIHSLVNGAMGDQKKLAMIQTARIAYLTKDPQDIAIAEEARRVYADHEARLIRVEVALAKEKQENPPLT